MCAGEKVRRSKTESMCEAGGMLETQVQRYCRWMILNTSGQPSKVTGKCTSTVHRRGEEETADRMKQVEMSVKVD